MKTDLDMTHILREGGGLRKKIALTLDEDSDARKEDRTETEAE
jgi:hypothetical protein